VATAPELVVRRATLEEIIALRHAELRGGLPLETARFEGDDDPRTMHWGAFLAGTSEAVGCATLVPRPRNRQPAWQLRGMATRADLVRRGIGSALLRAALSALRAEHGPVPVWCNARVAAVPFYATHGWEAVSDVFDIPTVGPHRVMVLTPPRAAPRRSR
jgi:predicted GNAT family N-acyltransferase